MSNTDEGEILQFPPMPKVPLPPRFPPDPRQRGRDRIVGGLAFQLSEGGMELASGASVEGYPASAVNLGQLKQALEDALSRFAMEQVRARWEQDVRTFVLAIVGAWTQRAKSWGAELRDNGIAIDLETQDDHGYYLYRFDVFPGRR